MTETNDIETACLRLLIQWSKQGKTSATAEQVIEALGVERVQYDHAMRKMRAIGAIHHVTIGDHEHYGNDFKIRPHRTLRVLEESTE